tara:strand:- start:715 stop:846 length:132 start_codon:yes stop_codon:yes gene_type:complete
LATIQKNIKNGRKTHTRKPEEGKNPYKKAGGWERKVEGEVREQ